MEATLFSRKGEKVFVLKKYLPGLPERAVWLVLDVRAQDQKLSLNAAVVRIDPPVGVLVDTFWVYCKRAEIDAGGRPGGTTTEVARIKNLEHEVK